MKLLKFCWISPIAANFISRTIFRPKVEYHSSWQEIKTYNFELQLDASSPDGCYENLLIMEPTIPDQQEFQTSFLPQCRGTVRQKWWTDLETGESEVENLSISCSCRTERNFEKFTYPKIQENRPGEEVADSEQEQEATEIPPVVENLVASEKAPMEPRLRASPEMMSAELQDQNPRFCQNFSAKRPCIFIKQCHLVKSSSLSSKCSATCQNLLASYPVASCPSKFFTVRDQQICKNYSQKCVSF